MSKPSIQEYLGVPKSWKMVEKVRHEIVLMPNKEDIKTAKRHDPLGCALHNAACRVFGIPNCAIGGRWAYIPQRDHKGKPYIAKMQATSETQRAIEAFDKTGTMPPFGFRFIPIAPSHFTKQKAVYNEDSYRRSKGRRKMRRRHHKVVTGMRVLPRIAQS